MKHKKIKFNPIKATLLLLLLLAASVLIFNTVRSYKDLIVTEMTLESSKVSDSIRYVYIADLHENDFGKDGKQLYDQIEALSPDFILIGGDIINWLSDNDEYAVRTIGELARIADVYFSIGNHEIEYMNFREEITFTGSNRDNSSLTLVEAGDKGFINRIESAGAIVLQKSYTDITVKGTKLRIGGAYEDMFSLDPDNPRATMLKGMYAFLSDFQDTDALTLYMVHRPYSFLHGNGPVLWDIDIVMCGHEHGGQVVLPGLGGFFSRERGFFPEYTHGVFSFDRISLIVSSGIGSHVELLPRFNNPPEIVLVIIEQES